MLDVYDLEEPEPFLETISVGSGPKTVLWVTGITGETGDLEELSMEMPDRTFKVVQNPWFQGRLKEQSDMNERTLNGLIELIDTEKPDEVAGHSLGDLRVIQVMSALRATRHSVRRIILVSPPFNPSGAENVEPREKPHEAEFMSGFSLVHDLLARLTKRVARERYEKMHLAHTSSYGKQAILVSSVLASTSIDVEMLLSQVRELTLPTLVITGGRDPMHSAAVCSKHIGINPKLQEFFIPGADHFPHVSKPAEMANGWREWAKAQEPNEQSTVEELNNASTT